MQPIIFYTKFYERGNERDKRGARIGICSRALDPGKYEQGVGSYTAR